KADNRRILFPYLVDCGSISWISSECREARRSLIESRVIHLETVAQNPCPNTAYLKGKFVLDVISLFLGECVEALQEIKELSAMLDENGIYQWGRIMLLHRAGVHLSAMDF